MGLRMIHVCGFGAECSSPPPGKEAAQDLPGLRLAHSRIYIRPMMALRLLEHPRAMFHRAALGIACRVIDPGNPGMGDGPGAHRAWFERYIEIASIQPLGPQRLRGPANRYHFSMSGRITTIAGEIMRCSNHLTLPHDHRPNRHFSRCSSDSCLLKSLSHRFGERPAGH